MSYSEECKRWTHLPLTADQLVSKVPTFVKHVCLTAGTGGAATALVYNGVDVSGELKIALSAIASTHFEDTYETPICFDKGIYIDVGSNVTLFTIQFREERG